ncbi:DUF6645 domain-containing protein [Escherichia coli]|uniref:DUF6645 domain-containing protein n=4 Tax=Escherichia coli TaxID=562 RepID=UPI0038CBF93E
MSIKHYDVVRAASPSDLAEKLTQKLKEGWQPFGSPVAITPYTLMQAIAAEGDVTTPVLVKPSDGEGTVISATRDTEYYFVVVLAGQSNSMAYGEGLPLPETYDRPDPRIKQLARRNTVTPGGAACKYNDIIPADHCLHDVEDTARLNHPKADLSKGQYGCVGQGLHIAKKLLPFIPANAGILLVPCCRGGSAFTTGADGAYSDASGATSASTRWGVDKPLYKDLIGRTKAALAKNPKNVLLAVVWMQGEFDFSGTPANHTAQFTALVDKYRADLADMAGQCAGGSASGVPWICGDTTYFWKQGNDAAYQTVYGGYKNKTEKNIHFVPFMTDENGTNVPTNKPEEDPDIPDIGYYGSKWRSDQNTWTSADRASHFSSWARRGIISDRLATAILAHAGRTAAFISGEVTDPTPVSVDDGDGNTPVTGGGDVGGTATDTGTIVLSADGGDVSAQGWMVEGTTVTTTANAVASSGESLEQNVLSIPKQSETTWKLEHATSDESTALLNNGGELFCRFRIKDGAATTGRYAFGLYWLPDAQKIPSGVEFARTGNELSPSILNFYVQTDDSNINLLSHCSTKSAENLKLGSFGAFDNEWHSIRLRYHGGGTARATLTLDNQQEDDMTLLCAPSAVSTKDILTMTSITSGDTYNIEVESLKLVVNEAPQSA